MGTNVYLYGFLSTLILIFLVSVAVAYKGYRTRILLRRRIDEALAAGVFIPGISPDDGTSTRRRREAGEKPLMSEVWLHRAQGTNSNVDEWDQLQVHDICTPSVVSTVANLQYSCQSSHSASNPPLSPPATPTPTANQPHH